NGTQSLVAFLAFSRGLEAEERGDFAEAARYYGEAADADPGFVEAREKRQTAAAVDVVASAQPEDVTRVGEEVASTSTQAEPSSAVSPITGALVSSVVDVAGTQAERATGGGGQQRIDEVNRPDTPPLPRLIAIIRIVVTIPGGG
ncbi:MAG: tetratricopeptide repeat protein, partial [Gemmatimonadota bacterium]